MLQSVLQLDMDRREPRRMPAARVPSNRVILQGFLGASANTRERQRAAHRRTLSPPGALPRQKASATQRRSTERRCDVGQIVVRMDGQNGD